MKNILIITIVMALICIGSISFADIFKFIDSRGVTHFTNVPKGSGYIKIISEKNTPSERNFEQIINSKSLKYEIKPSIIKAVIRTESDWNPGAVSKKGAIGLMQLMPSTAKELRVSNLYDPEENIEGGTKYLRQLLNRFGGNLNFALAAYNAGPAKVERSGGVPSITETKQFIKKVLKKSGDRLSRIYKVNRSDGTVLYTNVPSAPRHFKLSKF